MLKKITLFVLVAMVFVTCTTIPYSQQETKIQQVLDLINQGDAGTLIRISAVPFLFDTEMVLLDKDIKMIWNNFKEAHFGIIDAEIVDIGPLEADSYKKIADTKEVEIYFKKYLPKDAAVIEVQGRDGRFYLLLGSKDPQSGFPKVYGFTGPVL